jgi:hypothetical protein
MEMRCMGAIADTSDLSPRNAARIIERVARAPRTKPGSAARSQFLLRAYSSPAALWLCVSVWQKPIETTRGAPGFLGVSA